ncbi:ADP-ribosylglycohydrolase family protein [Nocardia sp. NEAU-G5]|uniref:ADP-ribosylglycohydrolase family protein n=1 Tax=Nocardia albiluteola TaxID=2842303 RepID=A0ABS6B7A3_9NOCA|nr:ADP-ribosylglycohydrolase family protein [Nocardia albiluteola]MBU3066201.1 ADP-ribosylglycohydrolase family protein [Nocardia albiluteola]
MDPIESASFGHPEGDPRALLYFEWRQRRESGYVVDDFGEEVRDLTCTATLNTAACWRLLGRVEAAPRDPAWPYRENGAGAPLHSPTSQAPSTDHPLRSPTPPTHLYDRILGGWLGRCVGCTLGRPLANGSTWTPRHIRTYLERTDAYPLIDYVPVSSPMPEGYQLNPSWPESTRGRVDGCPRDDDLDYTVLGLHLLEHQGMSFTPADVADGWLERLPFLQTNSAERVAYRNLIDGLTAPDAGPAWLRSPAGSDGHTTANYRNPYREWIGGLIRADIYGYVCPGDPARAAGLAARDASLSHTGNGRWAAMWAAAAVAAAFTAADALAAITVAQQVIPANSRLATALSQVVEDYRRGVGWEQAVAAVYTRHGHYNWLHAVPNACLIAAGLLWGEGDFTLTIALTVQSGRATDSTAATAGSISGILVGASDIPQHWTGPLRDQLRTAVSGYDNSDISALARRTFDLARQQVVSR